MLSFYFGGRKGSLEAKNSVRSRLEEGDFGFVKCEIMVQEEDLNSLTIMLQTRNLFILEFECLNRYNIETQSITIKWTGKAFVR